mmetsp:Transcript_43780/g.143520  ORF Transcript_43780/g.143520 Transcript_43780/m.143520 type:complete len:412 (+) Transcript_43780:759-1994(+)
MAQRANLNGTLMAKRPPGPSSCPHPITISPANSPAVGFSSRTCLSTSLRSRPASASGVIASASSSPPASATTRRAGLSSGAGATLNLSHRSSPPPSSPPPVIIRSPLSMSSTCIASPSRDSTSPPESLAATPRDILCEPEGSLRTQRRTTAAVRRRTLALLSVGLVAGTADALLTRLAITLDGASLAEWLAIKGLASALFSSVLLFHQNGIGAVRRLPAAVARVPAHFAAGALLHASALSCRAAAFYSTGGSAALALLLISLCPFWAALLGRVVLGDVLPRRTVAALVAATAAAAIGVILPSKPAYRWMCTPAPRPTPRTCPPSPLSRRRAHGDRLCLAKPTPLRPEAALGDRALAIAPHPRPSSLNSASRAAPTSTPRPLPPSASPLPSPALHVDLHVDLPPQAAAQRRG